METKLDSAISLINDMLEWYKRWKPEQYPKMFLQQAKVRSQLKDMRDALGDLPAIAAYGESQKGKSYLMGNLLQSNGRPFMVDSPDRQYNFVSELNPIGNGKEATGVVTRFSSFSLHPERYSAEYPIVMKVFSVADIVCFLTDGWHNDVTGWTQKTDAEIEEFADKIYNRYFGRETVQTHVTSDDVMMILHYIEKFVDKAQNIARSSYLNKLAMVIHSVPVNEFGSVFGIMWVDNPNMTELFDRLVGVLKELKFSRTVYLPVDALVHNGIKDRTIMSVDCLNGLYDPKFSYTSKVYLRKDDGAFECLGEIKRCYLSALCSEVVIRIGEKFLESDMVFSGENISRHTASKLQETPGLKYDESSNRYSFSRDLLRVSDLLDFPGARSRQRLQPNMLLQVDQGGFSYMVKVILRGKVSYLFNRYSDSGRVNLLMFCHDARNVNVTDMYMTVADWIHRYVGKNENERKRTMSEIDNRPPFFIISTMFNLDMVFKNDIVGDGENAVTDRWKGRFQILDKDCLQVGAVDWFQNWTAKGDGFRNAYVLRDFKYSSCTGEGNNLYEGYNPTDENPYEKSMKLDEEFYNRLRSTFISNPEVGKFVSDPEMCWDLSASINNDGSAYIIWNLTATAPKLSKVRSAQFIAKISRILSDMQTLADSLYERTDEDGDYTEGLKKIRRILLNLDCASDIDNYFFGHLIDDMQLTTIEAYSIVHKALRDPELIAKLTRHTKGATIRKRLGSFDTRKEGLEKLLRIYGFKNEEEARTSLEKQNIDINDVLSESDRRLKMSDLVAGRLVDEWLKKVLSPTITAERFSETIDPSTLVMITDRLVEVADGLDLRGKAADSIGMVVDVASLININESMVADILRNQVNRFVCDWGYSMRTPEDLEYVRTIDNGEELEIFSCIEKTSAQNQRIPDIDELSEMFNELSNDDNMLVESFVDNYFQWVACLKIGFLSSCSGGHSKPTLGVEANNAIGKIYECLCGANTTDIK